MTASRHFPHAAAELRGRVLVADASRTMALVAEAALNEIGLVAERAESAADAHARALRGDYDALLLDPALVLPTGIRLIQAIRADRGANARIPIIAMAGHRIKDDDPSLPAYVVRKPLTGSALRDVFAKALETMPVAVPLVDRVALSALWPVEFATVLRQVVAVFLSEAEERCAAIEAAAASCDRARLAHEAHGLKGGAANVGASLLSREAAVLETDADHASPDALIEAAAALRGVLRHTAPLLRDVSCLDG